MKKALDFKKLMKDAEERAKHKSSISTDKEIQAPLLKAALVLGQSDDSNYSANLKAIKNKKV